MTWEKLPAIEGSVACLTCGAGSHDTLHPDSIIGVGFGNAGYSRDGVEVWSEMANGDGECPDVTCADVEKIAAADPDHDWRIWYFAPLYEAEYQRQGEAHWVLVRKGGGFA